MKKKNIILWGAAIILVLAAVAVIKLNGKNVNVITLPSPAAQVQTQPTKAIDFTLTDLDGNKVSLKDIKGKSVYLNFWATWCPPCKREMPEIEKIYQQYKDQGLVVLAVDLGEDSTTVRNFMTQNNYNFTVLLDSNQNVATQYSITAIPTSYFIDKEGNIIAKKVGALSADEMKANVQSLLK